MPSLERVGSMRVLCKRCGGSFRRPTGVRARPRLYCSDECRRAVKNSTTREWRRSPSRQQTAQICCRCGAGFDRTAPNQRYCSPECRLPKPLLPCQDCGTLAPPSRGVGQRCELCLQRRRILKAKKKPTNPVYRSWLWPRLRAEVLFRDGNRCQIRLEGCEDVATQADHIVELEDGGAPFDLANLQAACRHCNVVKGHHRRGERQNEWRRFGSVRAW